MDDKINIFIINSDLDRLNSELKYIINDLNVEIVKCDQNDDRCKGCYYAHRKIAKIAEDRDLIDYVCMEDNIDLRPNYNNKLFYETIKEIRELKLQFVFFAHHPKPFKLSYKKIKNNIYTSNKKSVNGLMCYYIHKDIYSRFIKHKYHDVPVDICFKEEILDRDYMIVPSLFKRNQSKSTITTNNFHLFLRKYYFKDVTLNGLENMEMNCDIKYPLYIFIIFSILILIATFILFLIFI